MQNIKDVELWSIKPRAECPAFVVGNFSTSVGVYSVAKKGALKRIGWSAECRWKGDKPSVPFEIPRDIPRILVVYHGSGNDPTYGRLYVGD